MKFTKGNFRTPQQISANVPGAPALFSSLWLEAASAILRFWAPFPVYHVIVGRMMLSAFPNDHYCFVVNLE